LNLDLVVRKDFPGDHRELEFLEQLRDCRP
jgi:hypothetical protein